jgi:hypothetical protein
MLGVRRIKKHFFSPRAMSAKSRFVIVGNFDDDDTIGAHAAAAPHGASVCSVDESVNGFHEGNAGELQI